MEGLHPWPQVNSEKELMTLVTADQKGQISWCKAEGDEMPFVFISFACFGIAELR